ncbi:hypothetical protein V8C42DRAFT_338936 [Trichoderma barbatum]
MLAYLPVFLLAALAAALPESTPRIISRTALSAMSVQDAEDVCDPKQHLVCCDKDDECAEIDVGQINKSDFLYEHCTATVVCCDFTTEVEHSKIWGDIINNCIYVGSLEL